MKHLQKSLALFLVFALGLSLALPAMAAVNWNKFYFIKQPQDLFVPYGESYTLSVEVNIPSGVEKVQYQWYRTFAGDEISVSQSYEPTLQLCPGDACYAPPTNSNDADTHIQKFTCRVTAYADAGYQQETIRSNYIRVEVEGPPWEKQFRIITPPPEELRVKHGESFTLNVEMSIPEEADEVTYEWSQRDYGHVLIEDATGPTLHLNPGDPDYPSGDVRFGSPLPNGYDGTYYCEITAIDKATGLSKKLSTRTVVTVEGSFLEKLYSVTLKPFAEGIFVFELAYYVAGPFALLGLPLILILYLPLVFGIFVANFKGLF